MANRAELESAERIRERRVRAFAGAIQRWMVRRGDRLAREESDRLSGSLHRVAKAKTGDIDQLVEILLRFGLVASQESAQRVTRIAGKQRWLVDPKDVQAEVRTRAFDLQIMTELEKWARNRAKEIDTHTRERVNAGVKDIIQQASGETPSPSIGELSRRIREIVRAPGDKRSYVFTPERARVIARTELLVAENTGAVKAYEAGGVEEIEWLAFRDGRSGERRHNEMDGKTVKRGEKFKTPLGNKLRYPGDPSAPAEDIVNCRCTVAPVIKRRSK